MRKRKKYPSRHFGVTLSLLAVSGLCVAYAWFQSSRILPGVRVGTMRVGLLTPSEAHNRIARELSRPHLTLRDGTHTWRPVASDVGITYDISAAVRNAFAVGRTESVSTTVNHTVGGDAVPVQFTWDAHTVQTYLMARAGEISPAPVSARLVFDNGAFTIVPDTAGLVYEADAFMQSVSPAIQRGTYVNVRLAGSVEPAAVTAADLIPAQQTATQLLSRQITLSAQGKHFTLTGNQIATWVTATALSRAHGRELASTADVTNGPAAVIDLNDREVLAYLQTIAAQVDVPPQAQQTLKSTNKVDVLTSGVPGKQLVLSDALAQLTDQVLNGTADTVDLPMVDVPFPISYVTAPAAPVATGKAIAVDLTKQFEYDYQDGVLVYSSKISSGIHDWTPTGTFHVMGKTVKQAMKGPGYYVPNVPWILWFKSGGYSLHGVYWHHDFGIRPRSHGCVGEPLTEAEWIYHWADVGTPVVIYKS